MTFMSAHYIYLAGLTLMIHTLLALDGRIHTLKKVLGFGSESDIKEIHLSKWFEVFKYMFDHHVLVR